MKPIKHGLHSPFKTLALLLGDDNTTTAAVILAFWSMPRSTSKLPSVSSSIGPNAVPKPIIRSAIIDYRQNSHLSRVYEVTKWTLYDVYAVLATIPVKTPHWSLSVFRRTGPEWQPWRGVVAGLRLAEGAVSSWRFGLFSEQRHYPSPRAQTPGGWRLEAKGLEVVSLRHLSPSCAVCAVLPPFTVPWKTVPSDSIGQRSDRNGKGIVR